MPYEQLEIEQPEINDTAHEHWYNVVTHTDFRTGKYAVLLACPCGDLLAKVVAADE